MSIEMDTCTATGAAFTSYCNNFIIMNRMENGKFTVLFFTLVSVRGN
jgi:hypothetical protein